MILTIQSANRPFTIEAMEKALFPEVPLWIVPASQVSNYSKAKRVIGVEGTMPMKTKQLNYALDLGFSNNEIVVTMDDDFVKCVTVEQKETKFISSPGSLLEFVHDLENRLRSSKFYLAGFQSNLNAAWCNFGNEATGNTGMLLGQLLAHKPNEIRFDESLTMLEDLEYIINHYVTHKGIVRINDRMIFFHMKTSKSKDLDGGYSNQRSKERQQNTIDYIKKKYLDRPGLKLNLNADVGQGLTRNMRWKILTMRSILDFLN